MTHPSPPAPSRRLAPFLLAGRFLWTAPTEEPGDAADRAFDEEPWSRAAAWLPAWGLLIGGLYMFVFGISWRVFGEYQGIRWLPVTAVVAVDLALFGYRPLAGAVHLAAHRVAGSAGEKDVPVAAMLTVVLVALSKFALLICLPIGIWLTGPGGDSHGWVHQLERFAWLLPAPIYRPLLLMPLWGRFAMELVLALGRSAPEASGRLRRIASGVSLPVLFSHWLFCAVLTIVFCGGAGEHLARAVMTALGIFVVIYVAGYLMAHRSNGQSEATVGAACLVGEIAFLLFYIAFASAIYWY